MKIVKRILLYEMNNKEKLSEKVNTEFDVILGEYKVLTHNKKTWNCGS